MPRCSSTWAWPIPMAASRQKAGKHCSAPSKWGLAIPPWLLKHNPPSSALLQTEAKFCSNGAGEISRLQASADVQDNSHITPYISVTYRQSGGAGGGPLIAFNKVARIANSS